MPTYFLLDPFELPYYFYRPLGDCISDNNNIYVGLISTTLSRRLTMHLSDTSSIAQHLKRHSCPTAAAFVYIFYTLSATRVLNSFEELCITLAAAGNSFVRELNPHGGAHIVIHRQTVSFYQNSSVWLDTQDARSRDWNPSNFTWDCVSHHSATKRTRLA